MNFISNNTNKLDNSHIETLAEKFGLNKTLTTILYNRGKDTDQKINKFLNCDYSDLYNPFLLNNMSLVCDRIKLAVNKNESIVVFGDYDVDGISASYILWDYLKKQGANVGYFLPCRVAEGYGLTISAIDQVMTKFNPSLIITVDCGISCRKEVEYANSIGVQVLVTDHHEIPSLAPDVYINAKSENQEYPFKELCGAGIALKLVTALGGEEVCKKYLPVAMLATVADIVSLTDENRTIVKLGLSNADRLPLGIKRLIKACGVNKITAKEIAYKVAPKINAPGRLGDSELAIKLYYETDEYKINKLIDEILEVNKQRQLVCSKMVEECETLLKNIDFTNSRAIILKSPNQEKGLLGIVAAKISAEYNKPAFIFNEEDGLLKGSVRSIEGINAVKAFESVHDILEGYGGHAMAGGVSLKLENYEEFVRRILEYTANSEFDEFYKIRYYYDLEINANQLNENFVKQLDLLEPTGTDNKTPIFKINFSNCLVNQNKNYTNHFYLKIAGLDFTAFNFLPYYNLLISKGKKEALLEVCQETYKNKDNIKRYLRNVKLSDSIDSEDFEIYKALQIESINQSNSFNTVSYSQLAGMNNESIGNLVVAGSLKELELAKKILPSYTLVNFNLTEKSSESSIISAPLSLDNFSNFNKIIFLHQPSLEYVKHINTKIFVIEKAKKVSIKKPGCDRSVFADYFNLFKNIILSNNIFVNFKHFINALRLKKQGKSITEAIFCFNVFKELGIINVQDISGKFQLTLNSNQKFNLSDSNLLKSVNKE